MITLPWTDESQEYSPQQDHGGMFVSGPCFILSAIVKTFSVFLSWIVDKGVFGYSNQ